MINLTQHAALLIIIAKGQHGPLGWWTIAEGVANIVLSVIWGRSHGLLGVAMGTIVPMLVVKLFIQPWYAMKAAEMNAWDYLRKGLTRPLLAGVLFFVLAEGIVVSGDLAGPSFIGVVFAQVIIFLACTWFVGLTRAERQWLMEYARRHLVGLYCTLLPNFIPRARKRSFLKKISSPRAQHGPISRVVAWIPPK